MADTKQAYSVHTITTIVCYSLDGILVGENPQTPKNQAELKL